MKRKIIAGLITLLVVATAVMLLGCVEEEEISPSKPTLSTTSTPSPHPTLTPTPRTTVNQTPYPTKTVTPKEANMSVLSVEFDTEYDEFEEEYAITCARLRIKNDGDEPLDIDDIEIEISGDLPDNPDFPGYKPESIAVVLVGDLTVTKEEEIELDWGGDGLDRLLKGETYRVIVTIMTKQPPYFYHLNYTFKATGSGKFTCTA